MHMDARACDQKLPHSKYFRVYNEDGETDLTTKYAALSKFLSHDDLYKYRYLRGMLVK